MSVLVLSLFLLPCSFQADDPVVLIGLYNTSTYKGHPAETATYASPSVWSYTLDVESGALVPHGSPIAAGLNVSWIAAHPTRRDLLFAVSEVNEFAGNATGSVATLRFQRASGECSVLGRVSTHGAGPVFATIDATGHWLLVSSYGTGNLAVLPIGADGAVGKAAADVKFQGAGSHSVYIDPSSNRFVLAPVLSLDKVDLWSLSLEDGQLAPNPVASQLTLPAGFGPRHLAFSPSDPAVVLLADEGGAATPSRVTLCSFNRTDGVLTTVQTISTLAEGADPTALFPAEVLFAPDGRFAYVSVRDATDAKRDVIAIFRVAAPSAASGTRAKNAKVPAIKRIGAVPTGHYPRSMALDPSGRVLVVANQKGASVATYTRDASSGLLTPAAHELPMPDSPGFVVVL